MGASDNRILVLFAIESLLITLVNNLVANYNYLFATRLGANDLELSMVTMLPQLVGMLVLIPGGILTDRMSNKRNMLIISLGMISVVYLLMGFSPLMGSIKLIVFLILLSISTAPMTVYNISWQAYFSDVVTWDERRNSVLTVRNGINFLLGIIMPFCCGALLASAETVEQKLTLHQIFVWLACILLLLQISVLRKIKGGHNNVAKGIKFKEIKTAFVELATNKRFLGFTFVALIFYISWHIDWTIYFIGEVNYLDMNEAWLSYVNIGAAAVQFVTIRFWSKLNLKKGARFSIIFGGLGLSIIPVIVNISLDMPKTVAKPFFVAMNSLANFAFATVALNIQLLLLQVLPEKNKTLNISFYTVLVMLSNAFMPMAGVAIYRLMGADLQAFQNTYWIIFAMRLTSTILWFLRWWKLRKEADILT